jgi:hypothetical protein
MEDIDVDELIAELSALRIRVARLEADRDRENAARETTIATETAAFGDLRVGDRVQIKNRVRKPATWSSTKPWSEERERIATVTRITPEQIHFVTDNGTRTWRAPNNLTKL